MVPMETEKRLLLFAELERSLTLEMNGSTFKLLATNYTNSGISGKKKTWSVNNI